MSDCIFCKIIKEEIPSTKIYEDEKVLSFLDIKPLNPGHSLVIPKEHYENIFDLPDETLKHISIILKKLGKIIKETSNADGINISINNGKAAGQDVFHAHFHIIPRYNNDGYKSWEGNKQNQKPENIADSIKEKILEKF